MVSTSSRLDSPLPHRRKKLTTLFEHSPALSRRLRHLANCLKDVARTKVEATIELLHRRVDLVVADPWVVDGALLVTRLIQQGINGKQPIGFDVIVELCPRVRRCQ